MINNNKKLKPPIKYPGGKRFLVSKVNELWETSNAKRLVEPFSGGLSIALGILPKSAYLNDSNPHVINFYQWIKEGLEISITMKNKKSFYYQQREKFNNLINESKINSKECAELFYYLNRTGYNGLVRFNKSGLYNVPFGRYKKINYKRTFDEYPENMQSWEFSHGDFSKLKIKTTDLLYVDPPYDVEFRSYSIDRFNWEDQVRLIEWLSNKNCPVIISNQATKRIKELYKENGYKLDYILAPRMISCNGDRTPAKEVIATKNF
ncbi:MAG: Dam family site-specific DNA-(adenine-N6)-methyltransferase [Proteobacteria bacterium]|nr:Dam family site-specific DNA-(adenine-N6)-methyltransferase [Pseudomonadota bacterium]